MEKIKKYKIVYVITNCKKTGPMNQTLNIIKNLDKEMFEPVLVTLFEENFNDSMKDKYKQYCKETYCLKTNKLGAVMTGKRRLKKLFSEIKPDLIIGLGMPPYNLCSKYKDAKKLVTLRNYCYEDYPSKYGKYIGRMLAYKDMHIIKNNLKQGNPFVTCSKSLSDIHREKEGIEIPFIRNGVDMTKYTRGKESEKKELKRKLNIPENKKVITYSGILFDRKNQEELIQGVINSQYKEDVILLLLGDGIDKSDLEKKYKKHTNIVFAGNVSNVEEYLQVTDLYATTSKSEGMPNGVLEAMAAGVALLMSDIPQHQEVYDLDHRMGAVYKLGDIKDLTEKIDWIYNQDLNSMGEYSYLTVTNNLTAVIMSKNYQKFYLDILEDK
ncbi:Glycosyltransferase involved in cell wall bisynthesis [Granulicatella balaenopterae]|uniref:Glycosyltransferase involved in cell wall bisynthesis n=1 Tax=Granulicatella balaenopterae TaxID=137733 RepID=A0A1H9K909_9LACT|nr:glycosyltransferase [Granulicatella balaenopterae]SEQ95548.1 Glycosyltransferase involved in cell wall bisynthesis [Granulicatella balaenopterae]